MSSPGAAARARRLGFAAGRARARARAAPTRPSTARSSERGCHSSRSWARPASGSRGCPGVRSARRRPRRPSCGTLPSLRRGHHILAGRRGGQGGGRHLEDGDSPTRRDEVIRRCSSRRRSERIADGVAELSAWQTSPRRRTRRLLGGPAVPRDAGAGAAAGGGLRRHPLGRADVSWTWSSTSASGPGTCPILLFCSRHGRSCWTAAPARRGGSTPRSFCWSRSTDSGAG